MFNKKWYLLGLLPIAMVPLFFRLPSYSPTWIELNNSAHTILFSLLSFGLATIFHLPTRDVVRHKSWYILWLFLLCAGIGIEFIQHFINRTPSFYDVLLDSLGIVLGSLLYCALHQKRLFLVISACGVLMLALIKPLWATYNTVLLDKQMPVICNFDGSCPLTEGSHSGRYTKIKPGMQENALWPENTSAFGLLRFPVADHPGFVVADVFQSWTGYKNLCADIYWPKPSDARIGIHIHDNNHHHTNIFRKFDQVVPIKTKLNTLCVSLDEVKKEVDLTAAKTLVYYLHNPEQDGEVYIDNIRLE